MGFSVKGEWLSDAVWKRTDQGAFVRDESVFRQGISDALGSQFAIEGERYHLYVSDACPWAHRVMIVRHLFGLETFLPTSHVHPLMLDEGWVFGGQYVDGVFGSRKLHEIYLRADSGYTGRVTVPILFDTKHETIVNNESSEIIRMLNRFAPRTKNQDLDLYPGQLQTEIERWNERIYSHLNNGVYRCGFATSQHAYEAAVEPLFELMTALDTHLNGRSFLVGTQITEADIRLYTTLVRFDAVYHGHFKCNRKKLTEFRSLHEYTRRLHEFDGIGTTCNLNDIKSHYYGSHLTINPTGIIPVGPTAWP